MNLAWTKTRADSEFYERTKHLFHLSDEIEDALAEDYFHHPSIYTEAALSMFAIYSCMVKDCPFFTPEEALNRIREFNIEAQNQPPEVGVQLPPE